MTQIAIYNVYRFVIFLNLFNSYQSNEEFDLSVEEETRVNSVLIDLVQKYPKEYSSFYLDDHFFTVTQDGKLKIRSNIDLDTICINHEKCCGVEQCSIVLTIFYKINPNDVNKFMKIKVSIKDINDHEPIFKSPVQRLSVSEFAAVGKVISLTPARDLDFDKNNQIRNYTFFEESKTFDLDQTRIGSPALVILNSLDHEVRKEYNAVWNACDFKLRCAKQNIIIDIVDENDNTPKFEEKKLSIRIPEDFPVGKVVIRVNATDKDSHPYNMIKYGFWEDSIDRNIKDTFIVTENSGELRLKEKLNTRVRIFYKFKIFAEDANALNMEKDFVELHIIIEDVNDHSPKIDIINEILPISLKENAYPGHILSIKVSDNDLGHNGNVTCRIDQGNRDFHLDQSSDQLYAVRTQRSFDYEREKMVAFSINCRDGGTPVRQTQKSIEIKIIDVNEFTPEFSEKTYHKNVLENRHEGYMVVKVKATDRDGDATLEYTLEDTAQGYFTIEQFSGEIRTGPKTIDREERERFQFYVSVKDAKTNPNTGRATIVVEVIDENDNAPQFTPSFPSPRYSLVENSPIMTAIGRQIEASDADKTESNSKLQFRVEKTFDSTLKLITNNYFTISNRGTISNIQVVDCETNPNFTITIKVHDNGSPPLSSMMNLTIVIEDENDNSPVFVISAQDSDQQVMVNISSERGLDSPITTLRAVDQDSDRNGEVYYSLNGELENTLKINSTTGEVKLLRRVFQGSFRFIVVANDNGVPQRVTRITMILNVYGDDMNMLNSTIIILLLSITGIISLFLIVAITCVRRRPRSIPSFNQSASDIQKGVTINSPQKFDQDTMNSSLYYPPTFDIIDMRKPGNIPMDTFERDVLLTSNILQYNPNRYPEFGMTPNYLSPCVNIGRTTPTFRPNDRDDDSGDSGKGGSEDDVGLANLQMGQCGFDHLEMGNKGNGCSSSSPNIRSTNFHRYNYRSRNPTTFNMVPEDELVQNNVDTNTFPNRHGLLSSGFLKPTQNSNVQSYSCINPATNTYMPLIHNAYVTGAFIDEQTQGNGDLAKAYRDQMAYQSASSIQMCFEES